MFTKLLLDRRSSRSICAPARVRPAGAGIAPRRHLAVAALLAFALASPAVAQVIPLEKLDVSGTGSGGVAGVRIQPAMKGEIKEVSADLVSIAGPAFHVESADAKRAVVWLFLAGSGRLRTGRQSFAVEGETIARAPQGWNLRIDVSPGEVLHALRLRRDLTGDDLAEMKKFPENNAAPHVRKFSECPAYGEAIKSAKTVSRTLLPENFVPRMAMGTVETTGPDTVGAHRHPMLEQLFLGLRDNDITVIADDARANLTEFSILHIPLGSNHGAEVAAGKKLHYVWMDFFMAKEGQEWLKMHKPLEAKRP